MTLSHTYTIIINKEDEGKHLEVMHLFTAETVVLVSWAGTDPQTHQAAFAKCAQLSVGHTYLSETDSEIAQSCPTLRDPMGYSPPGSSVHGIFQAVTLEWVAISFSRGSS